jgi:hypothetical protein
MSQEISKPANLPVNGTFPRTAAFFDWGVYAIHRMEELMWAGKKLIFEVGFVAFVIYELALFAKHLLKMWGVS